MAAVRIFLSRARWHQSDLILAPPCLMSAEASGSLTDLWQLMQPGGGGGGVTARRTQREGLTWVSDRDVEIKLPVTLHRRRRRPPEVPFTGRIPNISG